MEETALEYRHPFCVIVHERRGHHQGVILEAAIPYRGRLNKLDRAGRFLLNQCDGVNILSEQYRQGCFFERNRYMVNHSSRVIAIYDGRGKGGTFYTMAYAHTMMRDVRAIMI